MTGCSQRLMLRKLGPLALCSGTGKGGAKEIGGGSHEIRGGIPREP